MTDPMVLVAGGCVGLGVAALAWWLTPAVPDPLATLERRQALAAGRAEPRRAGPDRSPDRAPR